MVRIMKKLMHSVKCNFIEEENIDGSRTNNPLKRRTVCQDNQISLIGRLELNS
jgi:hypothetical protein